LNAASALFLLGSLTSTSATKSIAPSPELCLHQQEAEALKISLPQKH